MVASSISQRFVATLVSAALVSTPALAEKAHQLGSLSGKDAWRAEQDLKSRGFKNISSHKNSAGYVYSYWWDNNAKDCVRVEVYRDTVESVADAKHSDCVHSDGSATALGVAAGLAILGAALASKSHHREGKNYGAKQTTEFDRGYKDGLYHAAYHNYGRTDAYSDGYRAGVDERNANLMHHHGGGGYGQIGEYKDLIGARAAGATAELGRRGFIQVDHMVSGNARYGIYWRQGSRQCLQVVTANGRIENITDIRTHPNCSDDAAPGGASTGSDGKTWFQRLVGANGDGAEVQLGNNGFRKVDSFDSGRNAYGSVWYNPSNRQCLQIITAHGRVDSAVDIGRHPRCR